MSISSIKIFPSNDSIIRHIDITIVDFPLPVLPIIPIFSPGFIFKFIFFKIIGLKGLYLTEKSINSILPFEGHSLSFILEGTLKENLDPLNKNKDSEILEILDSFCLFKDISSEKRLNIKIKEGGSNLSIGEKQLICFARAALKKSKLIILDEATSSMDSQSEEIIRKNMKNLFENCTVIIIAHHIQMVNKCQKIIVLDNGEIVECDSYENLMNNKNSKFFSLYEESLAS